MRQNNQTALDDFQGLSIVHVQRGFVRIRGVFGAIFIYGLDENEISLRRICGGALKRIIITVFLLACLPATCFAHPHLFVDAILTAVFDEKGLAGFEEYWEFDEMFSTMIVEEHDKNRDGIFDDEEIELIKNKAFMNLKNFGFFTHITIDGKTFRIVYVKDFKAEIKGEKISYSFFIPCHVAACSRNKIIKISIYDTTYYTAIQLLDELPRLKGNTDLYEIASELKRVNNFICFEENGYPETTIVKFRHRP